MKIVGVFLFLFALSNITFGQDTLRLQTKPEVILKSWYPEYKDFPALKIGEPKVILVLMEDLNHTSLQSYRTELRCTNGDITIEKTEKSNPDQYIFTAHSANNNRANIEVWIQMGTTTVLIYHNSQWIDIKNLYPVEDNKVLIATIPLDLKK